MVWLEKRRAIELLHRVGIKNHQDIMASYPTEITEGEGQKDDDCDSGGEINLVS